MRVKEIIFTPALFNITYAGFLHCLQAHPTALGGYVFCKTKDPWNAVHGLLNTEQNMNHRPHNSTSGLTSAVR
jgi:hypothetical protein